MGVRRIRLPVSRELQEGRPIQQAEGKKPGYPTEHLRLLPPSGAARVQESTEPRADQKKACRFRIRRGDHAGSPDACRAAASACGPRGSTEERRSDWA